MELIRPAFAVVMASCLVQSAASAVVEIPVVETGFGSVGAGAGASIAGPGAGPSGLSYALSAPTLTGSRLPPAVSPSPAKAAPGSLHGVTAGPGIAAGPDPGSDSAGVRTVPVAGPEGFQNGLKTVAAGTRSPAGAAGGSGRSGARAASLGKSMFDGAGRPGENAAVAVSEFVIRSAERAGHERRRHWLLNGRPARYLDGGGSKDLLVHPASENYLVTMFNQTLSNDALDSRSERQHELRSRKTMERLGFSPKVVHVGALEETKDTGTRTIHYFVQERVRGLKVSEVPANQLHFVRSLFDELIVRRIKIADDVHLLDNIMIGETVSSPRTRAFVVDNDGTETLAPRGRLEKWFGGEDPLAVYYEGLFRKIRAGVRAAAAGRRF